MLEKIKKNYRVKNFAILLFMVLSFALIFIDVYNDYKTNKQLLYSEIDKRLKCAATGAKLLLGEEFFQRALNAKSITRAEDKNNTYLLSKFANSIGVEYVYAMLIRGDKVYFTSSSATPKELIEEKVTSYFEEYKESTPFLKNIFQANKIVYEESTDKWGTFRSILMPFHTKSNKGYIVGADIEISYIESTLAKKFQDSLIFNAFVLFFLTIIAIYFLVLIKKDTKSIADIEGELQEEITSQLTQIKSFNKTLSKRVHEEVEKNREKEKQLLQQSRLAQMGEMISMIAHQWRQPLSAISATCNAMILKANLHKLDDKTAIELSEKIAHYSQHLSQTINDFRSFYKEEKEEVQAQYSEIAKGALDIVSVSIANKNIALVTDFRCQKKIKTYPNEVRQVILNLIKNAEDVLLEKKVTNPTIKIRTYDDNDYSYLEVSDNGGGIPEDIINDIFDPYFSTKKEKNGTGLGLYMSKIIIEEHCHGKLSVANSEEGAVFCIQLRAVKDEEL